jgi:UDP-3-O-[3-hydroxymyristoyl] glucosamine N-acyltransferase
MFESVNHSHSIHPTAVIDESATIGDNCHIGSYVVIGRNAVIGSKTKIESHVSIGDHVHIGCDGFIGQSVTITNATIGDKVFIKPGTCIGQQGFGFHMDEQGHFDVPQLGMVEIGNDVQIGSNVCIDRGSLSNTVICDGTRIDNLVQIAHNVYIGAMSVIVAQAGIAGSTRLGRFVVLAGQVGLAGHLNIGDYVKVAAQSGLMRDVAAGETVAGSPAMPVRDWHKQTILLQRLINENGKEKPNGTNNKRSNSHG